MTEPHIARLSLCGLAVFILAILGIIGSDDIWLIVLTFVAMALVAGVIVIDVWRLMADSSGDPADEDRPRKEV
jgi:hypothetical protein